MKKVIYNIFKKFGIRVITNKRDSEIKVEINNLKKELLTLRFLKEAEITNSNIFFQLAESSKSQLFQDWFVLNHLNYKRDGFFVEIGAANGLDLSNTYLLEKEFAWKGILSEPSPYWKTELESNRDCIIDLRCVYKNSNQKIDFLEADDKYYSTISAYDNLDLHHNKRINSIKYEILTVTLEDLFESHNAPKEIDYLSIDTEGSEYEILKNFNFDKYSFNAVTIEHNNNKNKDLIDNLFLKNGYLKKFEKLSAFESWFIKSPSKSTK